MKVPSHQLHHNQPSIKYFTHDICGIRSKNKNGIYIYTSVNKSLCITGNLKKENFAAKKQFTNRRSVALGNEFRVCCEEIYGVVFIVKVSPDSCTGSLCKAGMYACSVSID